MPVSSLASKLKLKPGMRAAIINQPEGYIQALSPLPEDVALDTHFDGQYDWVQVFVKNKADLVAQIGAIRQALKPQSLLWLTFPKGTSRIQTDLTRDQGWDAV